MAVGGAFGEDADRGAVPQVVGGLLERGSTAFEPGPEDVEKRRAGRFADQEDGFAGPQNGGEPWDEGKIPIRNETDQAPLPFEGEEHGQQEGFEAGAVVDRHDERVVRLGESFQAMDGEDIAPEHAEERTDQDPGERAGCVWQRAAPDFGAVGQVPLGLKWLGISRIAVILGVGSGAVGGHGLGRGMGTRERRRNGRRGARQTGGSRAEGWEA